MRLETRKQNIDRNKQCTQGGHVRQAKEIEKMNMSIRRGTRVGILPQSQAGQGRALCLALPVGSVLMVVGPSREGFIQPGGVALGAARDVEGGGRGV